MEYNEELELIMLLFCHINSSMSHFQYFHFYLIVIKKIACPQSELVVNGQ